MIAVISMMGMMGCWFGGDFVEGVFGLDCCVFLGGFEVFLGGFIVMLACEDVSVC